MNILIDGQTLHSHERNRGIGRYLVNILKSLCCIDTDYSYYISIVKSIDLSAIPIDIRKNVTFLSLENNHREPFDIQEMAYHNQLEDIVFQKQINIYWNPNPLMMNVLFSDRVKGCKNIATVHDVIPLIFPEECLYNIPKEIFENYVSRIKRLSLFDEIFTDSNSTKKDFLKFSGMDDNKVTVINYGIEDEFFKESTAEDIDEVKLRYGLPNEYIFTVGGPNFRKNDRNLISALSLLRNDLKNQTNLVLGSSYDSTSKNEIIQHAQDVGLENRIHFTGHIPDGDLKSIYAGCSIFVFPSLYEGFGIPVLEAMAAGKPIAASKTSSIPEVLGSSGYYFDPYNIKSIAESIAKLLENSEEREILSKNGKVRAEKFRLHHITKEINKRFNDINHEKKIKTRLKKNKINRKPNLAFFSPLNPQQSGISDYSEALLSHLKKYAEIDLFVDSIEPSTPEIYNDFDFYSFHRFDDENKKKKYDAVLHHMGNNEIHEFIYLHLLRYPGITVLHDYNIHPFIHRITMQRDNIGAYYHEIIECYNDLGKVITKRLKEKKCTLDNLMFPLNNSVITKSKRVIVHSEWAKRQIGSNHVVVVPLGIDIKPSITRNEIKNLRNKFGFDLNHYIIACFGDIVSTKRITVIIKSFSVLRLFIENAKLLLVGKLYHDMEKEINSLIERYKLKEFIYITGRVESDDFNDYIKSADVILNLRYPTMGETSLSMIKSMAFGKPVIVSNIKQFREIPNDCCFKIDVGMDEKKQLIDILMRLNRNPNLRYEIGTNARNYVNKNFNWNKITQKYLDVIYSTMSQC